MDTVYTYLMEKELRLMENENVNELKLVSSMNEIIVNQLALCFIFTSAGFELLRQILSDTFSNSSLTNLSPVLRTVLSTTLRLAVEYFS